MDDSTRTMKRIGTVRSSRAEAIDDATPVLDVEPSFEGHAPHGELREPARSRELVRGSR